MRDQRKMSWYSMKEMLLHILLDKAQGIVAMFVFIIIAAPAYAAPTGWKVSVSRGEPVWSKTFSKGELKTYVSGWKKLGGQSVEGWLKDQKFTTRADGRVTSKKMKTHKSKLKNSYYLTRFLNSTGQGKRISALTACGTKGYARIVEVVGPAVLFSKDGKKAIEESVILTMEVCDETPVIADGNVKRSKKLSKTDALKEHAGKRNSNATNIPALPLKPVKPPKGLKDMRGVIVFAIQPGGLFGPTSDVIATFKNGAYTTDLKRVFAEGVTASKAAKPNRWGQWRIKGGELELKGHNDKKFDTTRGDWIAQPGTANLKLNGCYGNITSASSSPYGGNTTVGNASSWCFKPNGRFSNSSTGFATASGGGVRGATSSSRNLGGRYRIDGYVARFVYDDGKEPITAFCFLSEEQSHIAINGKRYMGRD